VKPHARLLRPAPRDAAEELGGEALAVLALADGLVDEPGECEKNQQQIEEIE
jgi:hypothetical protein